MAENSYSAFEGSADPAGLVRVLREQGRQMRRRLADCPRGSSRYASLVRRIEENDGAIRRAEARPEGVRLDG